VRIQAPDASAVTELVVPHGGRMHTVINPSVLYFGTPVALISTVNPDGTTNLSPISSAWALGRTYALGISAQGQAAANLRCRPELVINLADASLVDAIEAIAPTTGANPVPPAKRDKFRHEPDKWSLGCFSPTDSHTVAPSRVNECPVQMEAKMVNIAPFDRGGLVVWAKVTRVHARQDLVVPGTSHLDLARWCPLYYTFRHYFAQGDEVGTNFRAEQ
jgi:flavin reductase (DIM6/NTAB) family NADH-FMN oxidoreductase RutF